ncbi:MAG: DUF2330 domain-containing protein [Bacteroidia bacterium]|nr:DUF2330 domain-containing protein [Bacteroidia bacterium]
MNKRVFSFLLGMGCALKTFGFCGFYVAKADASLFNKASQVILVRDGLHTVITMQSDFKGNVRDFAMVVPVPVVLERSDIKVINGNLFQQLDAYSSPRLVEYWDNNPCYFYEAYPPSMGMANEAMSKSASGPADADEASKYKVTIKAQYQVGEYDILILDAKESKGLEAWLIDNGYKIPRGASEVLHPYILSNMKFFVVKVNLDKVVNESQNLRPIQIRFESRKFMLPIRLGMANANGEQDMIVYAFTRSGRVECTNYRNVEIPTDKYIPEFTQDIFGKFYADLFKKTVRREGKNNIFLEYAWDISGWNNMKCDPCSFTPPSVQMLREAGVDWIRDGRWGGYEGEVFFTRMHVRYDREHFPQDLQFQETTDKRNFQCRYVITHPALGPFDCREGKEYEREVYKRRERELQQLASLTGWDVSPYTDYIRKWQGFNINDYPPIRTGYFHKKLMKRDSVILCGGSTGTDTTEAWSTILTSEDNDHCETPYMQTIDKEENSSGLLHYLLLCTGLMVLLNVYLWFWFRKKSLIQKN